MHTFQVNLFWNICWFVIANRSVSYFFFSRYFSVVSVYLLNRYRYKQDWKCHLTKAAICVHLFIYGLKREHEAVCLKLNSHSYTFEQFSISHSDVKLSNTTHTTNAARTKVWNFLLIFFSFLAKFAGSFACLLNHSVSLNYYCSSNSYIEIYFLLHSIHFKGVTK